MTDLKANFENKTTSAIFALTTINKQINKNTLHIYTFFPFLNPIISNCFETKGPEQLLLKKNLIPCILISAMFFFSSQISKQKASSLAKSLKSNTSLSLEGLDTKNKRRWDFQDLMSHIFTFIFISIKVIRFLWICFASMQHILLEPSFG